MPAPLPARFSVRMVEAGLAAQVRLRAPRQWRRAQPTEMPSPRHHHVSVCAGGEHPPPDRPRRARSPILSSSQGQAPRYPVEWCHRGAHGSPRGAWLAAPRASSPTRPAFLVLIAPRLDDDPGVSGLGSHGSGWGLECRRLRLSAATKRDARQPRPPAGCRALRAGDGTARPRGTTDLCDMRQRVLPLPDPASPARRWDA
jgi:hypothetical protein